MPSEPMDNYREMVSELLDLDRGLTDWEINFLDHLHDWQGDFTPKQIETLERIYDKRI